MSEIFGRTDGKYLEQLPRTNRRTCLDLLNFQPMLYLRNPMFRRTHLAVLACLAILPFAVAAQQLPKLEPLPPPPPPPPGVTSDISETPIRISPGANEQVEDVFVDGQRGVKVTQPDGSTYYLLPAPSAGPLRDPTDSGMRVPLWVIRQF